MIVASYLAIFLSAVIIGWLVTTWVMQETRYRRNVRNNMLRQTWRNVIQEDTDA